MVPGPGMTEAEEYTKYVYSSSYHCISWGPVLSGLECEPTLILSCMFPSQEEGESQEDAAGDPVLFYMSISRSANSYWKPFLSPSGFLIPITRE